MNTKSTEILVLGAVMASSALVSSQVMAQDVAESAEAEADVREGAQADNAIMDNIFVLGRRTSGLRGDTASAATLIDADLADIPRLSALKS